MRQLRQVATHGLPDEVTAIAASYDQTLRYGAQTPFSDQLAFHWTGSLWEYDAQHNSLITAGNGGTKPLQAAFTIYYNQGTQKYELEQTLQPDEQMWIDVGKLIREHVPDKNGTVLPANLASGSYEIRDLTNKGIGNLFEGKVVYDKTYGHVTYGCGTCCGYTAAEVLLDPLGMLMDYTAPNGTGGLDSCSALWEDVSDSFYGNWSTANPGIATVDYYGTFTGVSVGTTTSKTSGCLMGNAYPRCRNKCFFPGGTDNVTPTVSFIGGNNFIFEASDPTVTVFNGQQVQGSPSGGTFGWSATSTSSYKPQVLFNGSASTYSTPSGTVTVTVSGALSSSVLDTTLSVSYSENSQSAQTPATKAITIRQFEYLVQNGSIQNIPLNGPSSYGFTSTVYYNVYTHPVVNGAGQLVAPGFSGISVYEEVSLGQCNFPGANLNTGTGALNANSEVADDLSLYWSQPLPSNLNCAADQYLGVGGFIIRHNTLTWTSSGPTITNLGNFN